VIKVATPLLCSHRAFSEPEEAVDEIKCVSLEPLVSTVVRKDGKSPADAAREAMWKAK
jgi:hypothetical protein